MTITGVPFRLFLAAYMAVWMPLCCCRAAAVFGSGPACAGHAENTECVASHHDDHEDADVQSDSQAPASNHHPGEPCPQDDDNCACGHANSMFGIDPPTVLIDWQSFIGMVPALTILTPLAMHVAQKEPGWRCVIKRTNSLLRQHCALIL